MDVELESYLVFLLGRFNQRPDIAKSVLATEFLSSLEKTPHKQRDGLRDVGDKCLLFAGFFPEQAEKKCVKVKYFVELGQTAYIQLAELSKRRSAALYHALGCGFVNLMEILHVIRGLRAPMADPLTPLQAIELWTDVNSQYALTVLRRRTSSAILSGPFSKQ